MSSIISRVLAHVTVYDLLKYYDLYDGPKKATTVFCPFHMEGTPSARLYLDGRLYCFGACQSMYDPIDFVMLKEDLAYKDAVRWLGAHYGFEVDDSFFTQQFSEEEVEKWEALIMPYKYKLKYADWVLLWKEYDAGTLTDELFQEVIVRSW